MANGTHLRVLKEGVEAWNAWRASHPWSWPDFRKADLHGINLSRADLRSAQFREANLSGASLSGANLAKAELWRADLSRANLSGADLPESGLSMSNLSSTDLTEAVLNDAKLCEANLTGTDFSRSILNGADLTGANLSGANLTGVDLREANLTEANFEDCNVAGAKFCRTVICKTQICRAHEVDNIDHWGPSFVDVNTILSQEKPLPEVFLHGIGLNDEFIEYLLVRWQNPLVVASCFISHAPADKEFAGHLHSDFQAAGIRCWKWNCKNETGRRIWPDIYHHLREHSKLVVIASEESLNNGMLLWVVQKAVCKEAKRGPGELAFFPVAVDDYWKGWKPELAVDEYGKKWKPELKEQFSERIVANAKGWDKDPVLYKRVVNKLIEALKKE